MNDVSPIPLRADLLYLLPTAPSFWRWSGDARWIEWADGRTITHRDELLAILSALAPRGLPPLGALLLVLAATKSNWNGAGAVDLIARAYAADKHTPGIVDTVIDRRVRSDCGEVMTLLQSVADLPARMRNSVPATASLLDFIFQLDRPVSSVAAAEIVALLGAGLDGERVRDVKVGDALRVLADALDALNRGLDQVAGDVVDRWQKTGIAFDLAPAVVTLPPATRVRTLVRALRTDDELAGLARVAADLLAAIHVPRAVDRAEDLPLGGVSDVSNKGNLDRLLLSELAHDDLTLAVRVALGEALYLRREAPARHPPVGRWIVLDSGIRLWGVARLFAAAVGLALGAASDPSGTLRIFHARGAALEPVDFTTRAGVAAHLAVLEVSPDPLPALLAAARRAVAGDDADDAAVTELVLVTHEQTANDPGFLAALSGLVSDRLTILLATVTAGGDFALGRVAGGGRTPLAGAKLAVDALVAGPNQGTPDGRAADVAGDASLPLFLRLGACPLLLPARVDPRYAAHTPQTGLIGVTPDRRLMRWTGPDRAGEQLEDRLPDGTVQGVFIDSVKNSVHVVIAHSKTARLSIYNYHLESGGDTRHEFAQKGVTFVTHRPGAILVISGRHVGVFDAWTGAASGYDVPLDHRLVSGRFFKDPNGTIFAAGATGLTHVCRRANVVGLIDHAEWGPVRVWSDTRFEVVADGRDIELSSPERRWIEPGTIATSPDGRRVIGHVGNTGDWVCVDLDKVTHRIVSDRDDAYAFLVGKEINWSHAPRASLRRKLIAIGRDAGGHLAIRTRTGFKRATVEDNTLRWSEEATHPVPAVTLERAFEATPGLPGCGFTLRKATWADGSAAWLDSRGLLHLASSDPALPQVTLTLPSSEYPIAGWLDTHTRLGPLPFLGAPQTLTATTVADVLKRFVGRL